MLDVGRSLRYFLLNVVGDLLRRRVPGLDCLDNEGIRPGWTTVYASCRTLKCVPCQALVVGESVMASLLTAVIIGGVASLVVASRE